MACLRSCLEDPVQPIRCRAIYRPEGEPLFTNGAVHFTMVRLSAPRWTSCWKAASLRPVGTPDP